MTRRNRRAPGRAIRGLSLPGPRPGGRGPPAGGRQPQPPARDRPLGCSGPRGPSARRCSPAAAPATARSCWPSRWPGPGGLARSPGWTAARPPGASCRRAPQARALSNIGFESRSILDLPGSGLGPFDYIDCCGVLHHLPDPAAGLRALLSVLAPDGGLGLMVYAPHGRTGVYMVQDALGPPGPAGRAQRRQAGHRAPRAAAFAADQLAGGRTATSPTTTAAAMPGCTTCC